MSDQVAVIRKKYLSLEPNFQELIKRHWLASEAIAIGRGGIEIVHEATGASPINLCKSNVIIDQEFIYPKNEKYLFFFATFFVLRMSIKT